MSNNKPAQLKDEPLRPHPVLEWAMCHPGVLLFSSLAVGAMLACRREINQETITDRQVETEADIIDGDVPLFI
jgi:hypothetical protein